MINNTIRTIYKGLKATPYKEIFFLLGAPVILFLAPYLFNFIIPNQNNVWPMSFINFIFSAGNVLAVFGILFALIKFHLSGLVVEQTD